MTREIFRRDQRRTAQVSAQISDGTDTPSAIAAVVAALDAAGHAVRVSLEEA